MSTVEFQRREYSSALDAVRAIAPQLAEPITRYIKSLRAECASYRVQVREAEKEIAYLEGRLEALGVEL